MAIITITKPMPNENMRVKTYISAMNILMYEKLNYDACLRIYFANVHCGKLAVGGKLFKKLI